MPSTTQVLTAEQIVRQYPIRNRAWTLARGKFVAEMSEIDGKDPWNRPFRSHSITPHRDREHEITHWTGSTTVAGSPVQLDILND